MSFTLNPVGIIHSCYKEKFGIPRQPGLVTEAKATLELLSPYNREEAVRGLEDFSHIWITFIFHGCLTEGWKPTVRPPRLGGNKRVGVFSTRSTYRPNPIGLSVVELEKVVVEKGSVVLHLKGADLLDQTPVLDIKPYLPYVDSIPGAKAGFAPDAPSSDFAVTFSEQARQVCQQVNSPELNLAVLINQILSFDPRPAYNADMLGSQNFAMKLLDFDVKWWVEGKNILVTDILKTH